MAYQIDELGDIIIKGWEIWMRLYLKAQLGLQHRSLNITQWAKEDLDENNTRNNHIFNYKFNNSIPIWKVYLHRNERLVYGRTTI